MELIRNIAIIAHVDHGKSTLADRILERTGAIEERKMKEQVLDRMDLERERGITIKMQPVTVHYRTQENDYLIHLIDTPGHIDFSYEVSRSLTAVEGVLMVVDATQGVQAQTLSVVELAREAGKVIVPVLSKIDMPHARIPETRREVVSLLNCKEDDVLLVSGKTGEGVEALLKRITEVVPPPQKSTEHSPKALVFDFSYSDHTGITAFVRVLGGTFTAAQQLTLLGQRARFRPKEIGICVPDMKKTQALKEGEIGYIVTGIKETAAAVVGDTITLAAHPAEPVPGYREPTPVIWASLYPRHAESYTALQQTLKYLRLTDAAFSFEEEQSTVLGKGFRCGFLGMLHLEIVTERVKREGGIELITTSPTTDFTVTDQKGETKVIATPERFPDRPKVVTEPWVAVAIITPSEYLPALNRVLLEHEGVVASVSEHTGGRCRIQGELPLRELMRSLFDKIKGVSAGYASLSYERIENRPAEVTRMDILLAEELFPAFSSIVAKQRAEREARRIVEILHESIPRTLFAVKIQAKVDGRILASKTLPALRKDVTAKLYGGDITRKMKLREKQKKGKKKMGAIGKVQVPHDTFIQILKKRTG